MASVQFFGEDQVMNAVAARRCTNWAIFIGRALFMKYEGSDETESMSMLQEALTALGNASSAAIYSLKCFEGSSVKITEKTVCDAGQFNFKLIEPDEREGMVLRNSSQYGAIGMLQKEVKELKELLAHKDDEEHEPQTLGGVLMGLLDDPQRLIGIVQAGRALLGYQNAPQPAMIGNTSYSHAQDNAAERIAAAIDELQQSDPKLLEHLEKLAKMSRNNKQGFTALISMLDLQA